VPVADVDGALLEGTEDFERLRLRCLKEFRAMALIIAGISFAITCIIYALVMFLDGMGDDTVTPIELRKSKRAHTIFTVGTLISIAIASSYWLLPNR
jgi:hypothetical protein